MMCAIFRYKMLFCLGWLAVFVSCSKSASSRNPNLGEIHFSTTIDLNLPLYNALKYPQNTIYLPKEGIKGIFVTNIGNNTYRAWEAACPNQSPLSCERLKCAYKNGDNFEICIDNNTKTYIFVKCTCDQNVYNLINGNLIVSTGSNQYPLLNYSVSIAGTKLTISN